MKNADTIVKKNISELISYRALQHPDAVAMIFGGRQITYSELNRQANHLAHEICSVTGESKLIGISTTRSIETIIGIVAILKSGKAYLPLDSSHPEDRLQQIISDAGLAYCLADAEESPLFKQLGVKSLNYKQPPTVSEIPEINVAGSLIYVLYTSGSTGAPKGVMMGQEALLNLLNWQRAHSMATEASRTLQFAPLTFDVSFQEIFATLTTGGTLILIEDDLRLDSHELLTFIDRQGINRLFLPFVALQMLTDTATASDLYPGCLKEVATAGEQLKITPQVVNFFSRIPGASLYNQYGPTESHVVTALKLDGAPSSWPTLPTIGHPIWDTDIYILDEELNLLREGEIGELCISGVCLAEGYLNREDLTAEKFMTWQHPDQGRKRIYRTGDLARLLPDGNIEFLGRKDYQLKVRGHRVEPGEIEAALTALHGIKDAVVVAFGERADEKKLVTYLIPSENERDTTTIRQALEKKLPDYMIPSAFVWMEAFPKTSSGKIDRKALPAPEMKRPDMDVLYAHPINATEKNITDLWAGLLQYDKVGIHDNFFELGGNSLLAQKTVNLLRQQFGYQLPITRLYREPTAAAIAAFLSNRDHLSWEKRAIKRQGKKDIAIIAMEGRFPGAHSIEAFWELLKEGREAISRFDDNELDASVPEKLRLDPAYVKARGIIEDADLFDAAFFGINPVMAAFMDPQQRLFLELSRNILEKSGYLSEITGHTVGVFAGCNNNTYYLNNVLGHPDIISETGSLQVNTVSDKDYIASRTAYQLNLRGPAVSVFSACSTSLLAVVQAYESLQAGQCDVAIAGGVTITAPIKSGQLYQEGAMFSEDGHTRPFDAAARGTVFSDGAGIVLLKPLDEAIRDRDPVYAVIKGVGVNNDGGGKGSFSAPSAAGQAGAIAMAIDDAGVTPADISYVEAHGTATPLGDPIEMEGLGMAFGEPKQKQFCAVGSVKGNIGHLTHAAGVAGLIKTALSLHYKTLPPSIHYNTPNPAIDFANSPFRVNNELRPWNSDKKRVAGVSSFGVGGTNVHVILEEAPIDRPVPNTDEERPLHVVAWSAKSEKSLMMYAEKLASYLDVHPDIRVTDIAHTLSDTRPELNHRCFVVAANGEELSRHLRDQQLLSAQSFVLKETAGEVAFMFPGQGAQYVSMGSELYEQEPVFRQAIEECRGILQTEMGEDLLGILFPDENVDEAADVLKNTYYTQPALFVVEYAMARWWMSLGIEPAAFVGHSVGEFVAAHLAGIFSLPDALKLIAARGRLISSLPRGSMLSVRKSVNDIARLLPDSLSVAAINAPSLCVVAGKDDDIAAFAAQLDQQQIASKLLYTSHAFHSGMMDAIVPAFEEVVRSVELHIPRIPIASSVTGKWLKDEEATDPAYWSNHIRATVRFSDAILLLYEELKPLFLETGPGSVTATLARQHGPEIARKTIEGLKAREEYRSAFRSLGRLWTSGISPDWDAVYLSRRRDRVHTLPTYAFDRKRYWMEPVTVSRTTDDITVAATDNDAIKIPSAGSQKDRLGMQIRQMLTNASGLEITASMDRASFLELGLDSLLLTQIAFSLQKEFEIPISFRLLNEQCNSVRALAEYLAEKIPSVKQPDELTDPVLITPVSGEPATPSGHTQQETINSMARQLNTLSQQMAQLLHLLPRSPDNNGDAKPGQSIPTRNIVKRKTLTPPITGARLGKDRNGNPAWFIEDQQNPGKYLQITESATHE